MTNVQLPPGMTSQQFQKALTQWVTQKRTARFNSMYGRALIGPKLGWVIKGEMDKFETIEDALRYLKVFEELSSTEEGRKKLDRYLREHELEDTDESVGGL